ncbi:MAG: Txe/YoeB family addiction module toxin [Puniceicoccales bacterium]|jgi:toxin YoeB|nr:Txe/YoeB family addiction module toxin [Puniceicoccales bacterium]
MKYEADYSPKFKKEYKIFQDFNSDKAAKIKILIADTLEHPMEGLGKPERLRHLGGNVWSRHVDKKNRLVYKIIEEVIRFECCRGHYKDH